MCIVNIISCLAFTIMFLHDQMRSSDRVIIISPFVFIIWILNCCLRKKELGFSKAMTLIGVERMLLVVNRSAIFQQRDNWLLWLIITGSPQFLLLQRELALIEPVFTDQFLILYINGANFSCCLNGSPNDVSFLIIIFLKFSHQDKVSYKNIKYIDNYLRTQKILNDLNVQYPEISTRKIMTKFSAINY